MVIWSAKISKSYLKEEPETYLTPVFFKDSCGFLLYFRLNERHHFPLLFHTQRRPSIRLYAFITCDWGGGPVSAQVLGAGGGGCGGLWPPQYTTAKMVTVQRRKEKDALPGRGTAVARLLAPFWTIKSLLWGSCCWGGGRGHVNLLQKTHSDVCLCIYVCTYIYTKHCTKKNPVVHHLWQKRKKKTQK